MRGTNSQTHISSKRCYDVDELSDSRCFKAISTRSDASYNKSKEFEVKGGYGGRSSWGKFVENALNKSLVENGYLLYVHPPSWRKPGHK
jgi:hypothetical protein